MRLGTSLADRKPMGVVEYHSASCCLCTARFEGKMSDARLREHFMIEHNRQLISRDERNFGKGKLAATYSGPTWVNDTEDGINKIRRGKEDGR